MDISALLVVAVLMLGFGLVSRRIEGTAVTAPMIFVAVGLAVGPHALGLVDFADGEHMLHFLAEITLIFVLFGDAARIDVRALRRELGLPVRLLAVGLPLCIGLGALTGKLLFPGLSWLEAGVLGAVLAPTDAALGQAVVSSESVPLRIRQALNVESGLNDGIALPVVMVLAALGSMAHGETRTASEWATFAALQVTLGPIAGVAVGALGARAIVGAHARGWLSESFERLSGLALALLAFGSAEAIGGNGFIAAFVAGMTLGAYAGDRCAGMHHFLEAEGQLLMLLVFLLLGAALLWPAIAHSNGAMIAYAALSLTVVRMAPAAVSMVGSGLRVPTVGFLGWFGPRGLASVLFAILIVSQADLPNGHLIFSITMLTVLGSIVLHGITAAPLAAAYGKLADDPSTCPGEHVPVFAHPLRQTRSDTPS
jgi:NhaP-type Na+/H+ or K+/H+ antiporter